MENIIKAHISIDVSEINPMCGKCQYLAPIYNFFDRGMTKVEVGYIVKDVLETETKKHIVTCPRCENGVEISYTIDASIQVSYASTQKISSV